MNVPAGSLDPNKEYQFVVVLKDGQRLMPPKTTEEDLHKWLRHPRIPFVTSNSTIEFTPDDIQNIEVDLGETRA